MKIPKSLVLVVLLVAFVTSSSAETRSAQDMARECRVALDLLQGQGHIEKTFENTLFTGEYWSFMTPPSSPSGSRTL